MVREQIISSLFPRWFCTISLSGLPECLEFPGEATDKVSVPCIALTSTASLNELHVDLLKLYTSTCMNIHIDIFISILLQINYSFGLYCS